MLIVGTGIGLAVIGGVGFLIGTFIGIRLGGATAMIWSMAIEVTVSDFSVSDSATPST